MSNYLPYDEATVLARVAGGDEPAFTLLFETWEPHLSAYIFRITRSKESTAEIVQDVFLKIWLAREALHDVVNFRAYLFVISRNHAINVLKKTMRDIRNLREWIGEAVQEGPGGAQYPFDEPDDSLPTLVDEAIEQLSPRQKEVYLLHRHQRLSYNQIAERLGIGRESVKTHMELAIKGLTRYLKGKITPALLCILLLS